VSDNDTNYTDASRSRGITESRLRKGRKDESSYDCQKAVCNWYTVNRKRKIRLLMSVVRRLYLHILTRLSHPPDTKRLTGVCEWPSSEPGWRYGPQLTALQPIWQYTQMLYNNQSTNRDKFYSANMSQANWEVHDGRD